MSKFESDKVREASKDDPLDQALRRWANDADAYRPFDTATVAAPAPKTRRTMLGLRTAATLAAAAMFAFALAQVSFSVSLGDTTLRWGDAATDDIEAVAASLAETEARYTALEQRLATHADAINTVAIENAMLGESLQATAIELAQRQELESAARLYDMQHLAQLVSFQP